MATCSNTNERDAEKTLLRQLIQARVNCENCSSELETLDGMTDDWNPDDEALDTAALEIHLQSEYSRRECTGIYDTLTSLLTGINTPGWLWTEVEVRQENAAAAAEKILQIVNSLPNTASSELGLKELKRRLDHVIVRLAALKESLGKIEQEVSGFMAAKQAGGEAPS